MNKPEQKYLGGSISIADIVNNNGQSRKEHKVWREWINGHLIDTCFTPDTGFYETAVANSMSVLVVVSEYETEKEAEIEHKKWTDWVKNATDKDLDNLKDIHDENRN